jgi:hypothetical protein
MQPKSVYDMVLQDGKYQCDPTLMSMPEFTDAYDWLAHQMANKIGLPPEGVRYPVWAWYSQNGKHKKPDLRTERWGYGPGDEDYVCLELEVPDDKVLLSDFDSWHAVLNGSWIADSEAEWDEMESKFDSMTGEEKRRFLTQNWERVFDTSPVNNDWMSRGSWVQATFWTLEREYVRKVRHFRTGKRR